MKRLAFLESTPRTLAALEQAIGERGSSSLDRSVADAIWHRSLTGPAREFLSRPGKQLREAMVRIGWLLAEGRDPELVDRLGVVVELIHAGSLVIDDVEDGADMRRGAPALHKLCGVPIAINTGSWMYFWALAEIGELGLPEGSELAVYRAANAALVRCHQGQALDLATRITELALGEVAGVVDATTRLKTGELCGLAASIAALALGRPACESAAARRLGTSIGIALQMLDDLGSLSPSRRDKGREDLRNQRPTWPWAWLVETQPFLWSRFVAQLAAARSDADLDAVANALAVQVGDVGRARIRALIDDTIADVAGRAGNGPAIATVGAMLSDMEKRFA